MNMNAKKRITAYTIGIFLAILVLQYLKSEEKKSEELWDKYSYQHGTDNKNRYDFFLDQQESYYTYNDDFGDSLCLFEDGIAIWRFAKYDSIEINNKIITESDKTFENYHDYYHEQIIETNYGEFYTALSRDIPKSIYIKTVENSKIKPILLNDKLMYYKLGSKKMVLNNQNLERELTIRANDRYIIQEFILGEIEGKCFLITLMNEELNSSDQNSESLYDILSPEFRRKIFTNKTE